MIVGIGVDIVTIERIARIRERHGERFSEKIFTPEETSYCLSRKNSNEHFAARFAAKEAVMKALGTGWSRGVGFRTIEVIREEDGPPQIMLHGGAKEHASHLGVSRIHISLSHTRGMAIAQAVLERD